MSGSEPAVKAGSEPGESGLRTEPLVGTGSAYPASAAQDPSSLTSTKTVLAGRSPDPGRVRVGSALPFLIHGAELASSNPNLFTPPGHNRTCSGLRPSPAYWSRLPVQLPPLDRSLSSTLMVRSRAPFSCLSGPPELGVLGVGVGWGWVGVGVGWCSRQGQNRNTTPPKTQQKSRVQRRLHGSQAGNQTTNRPTGRRVP